MDVTDHSFIDPDIQVAAPEVVEKIIKDKKPARTRESAVDEDSGKDSESGKKTITLLSRENSDKIAVEKYDSAAKDGEPLSILIIEVDGLSKLREQDGDQVAYKVFAAIVKYIFSKVDKEKDIMGRYGQNGLSVLMPDVDMNAAEKFAEKIRQFVENARYKTSFGEKSATLSIGVAAMTDETGNYTTMVKRADMALFVAKKNGRNCVKVRL
jgi:diguanylate cyclase (GGDEF)-like protein